MVKMHINLTDEEKIGLQDIADETGVSQSELIRQATLVTLNEHHFPTIRDIGVPYRKGR